jgi:hypothetical protein
MFFKNHHLKLNNANQHNLQNPKKSSRYFPRRFFLGRAPVAELLAIKFYFL